MASNLLVLGATGPTGRHVVSQALDLGHNVTVFVRSRERLEVPPDRVRVVTGSLPDDERALMQAIHGQDVVVSALGIGQSFTPNGLIARSAPLIGRAMESQGVRRLIFTSAFGIGPTWDTTPFLPRLFIRTLLRRVYADKEVGEEAIKRSGLDWTLVYPVGLTNGPRTGRYQVGERLKLRGFPTISRADVAAFLLTQIEDRSNVRKGVLIGPSAS
jgi:putative NADH-flavin reductase